MISKNFLLIILSYKKSLHFYSLIIWI